MKALIYVQHLLGIGHLARVSRIALALKQSGADVTLVSGGPAVTGFPKGDVPMVQLPPIRSRDAAFSALVDDNDEPVSEAFKAERCRRLLAEFDAADPDALVIEAFPFGRRQMRFELLPLIERAKAKARPPLIASSVRDILQENRKAGRAEETLALVKEFFDLILVHGDPGFARLEETFPLAGEIGDRIAYTGLVAGEPVSSPDHFDVVVSAGGGIVGERLVATAAETARRLAGEWPRWCIITGPHFPPAEKAALSASLPAGIRLETFRPDFPGLLANARLSISQAGYNTACDLLRARCRSVLIPFATGGETEQSERARRLEKLGLAALLTEAELSPESLGRAMARAPSPAAHRINLDGAAETARILSRRPMGRQWR